MSDIILFTSRRPRILWSGLKFTCLVLSIAVLPLVDNKVEEWAYCFSVVVSALFFLGSAPDDFYGS